MLRQFSLRSSTSTYSHMVGSRVPAVVASSPSSSSAPMYQRFSCSTGPPSQSTTRTSSFFRQQGAHPRSRTSMQLPIPTVLNQTSSQLHQHQRRTLFARVTRNYLKQPDDKSNQLVSSAQNPVMTMNENLNASGTSSVTEPEFESKSTPQSRLRAVLKYASATIPSITACQWFVLPTSAADAYARLRFLVIDACTLSGVFLLSDVVIVAPAVFLSKYADDPSQVAIFADTILVPFIALGYVVAANWVANKSPHKFSLALFTKFTKQQPPRSRWLHSLCTSSVGCLFLGCTIWFMAVSNETEKNAETPCFLEILLDIPNSWLKCGGVYVVVSAPIGEEILFRALIFGRLAMIVGIIPAALLSTGLFAFVHGEKAAVIVLPSAIWTLMYVMSGSLLFPCLSHMANNAFMMALQYNKNPLAHDDDLAAAILLPFGRSASQYEEWWRRISQRWFRKDGDPMDTLLSEDMRSLKPDVAAHVRSIFHLIDTEGKGYLTSEQFAYLASLQPSNYKDVCAITRIIARRTNSQALSKMTEEQRARMMAELGMKNLVSMRMPHELIGSGTTDEDRSHETLAFVKSNQTALVSKSHNPIVRRRRKRVINWFVPPNHSAYGYLHDSIDVSHFTKVASGLLIPDNNLPLSTPLQSSIIHRWYTRHFQIQYARLFHRQEVFVLQNDLSVNKSNVSVAIQQIAMNGCTPEAFESYVARLMLLEPNSTCVWISRMTQVMMQEMNHPLCGRYVS